MKIKVYDPFVNEETIEKFGGKKLKILTRG